MLRNFGSYVGIEATDTWKEPQKVPNTSTLKFTSCLSPFLFSITNLRAETRVLSDSRFSTILMDSGLFLLGAEFSYRQYMHTARLEL